MIIYKIYGNIDTKFRLYKINSKDLGFINGSILNNFQFQLLHLPTHRALDKVKPFHLTNRGVYNSL